MFVIGIDVGGTFTDIVCSDGNTTWRAKSPTEPARFSAGVLAGCALIAEQIGLDEKTLLSRVSRFGLGTTAVTNVLATRRGLKVGLITTAGFENHLHAARGSRVNVDGWLAMPWNPIDRKAIVGIAERIDREGTVLKPIDLAAVKDSARALREEQGVEAFAISFLWSCRNPAHEADAAETVRAMYPDLPVYVGSELHPLTREYERTTMALLNAFTARALDGVEALEDELKARGLRVPMLLLHSGGGAITVGEARSIPLGLASSGPAAGAVAAAEVARAAGYEDALCCDMGGTSIDVAVVRRGTAERSQHVEINGIATGQSAIDVESIGAGGGSIAWVDKRGALRVGPQSARATPGPVCYGRGGTEPTVTDAMLVLGYIDAASFMGGTMTLNVDAARTACGQLGEKLGLSAIETAYGIREIALAEMAKAIRARIASGGLDARKFAVVAFGGSGSLFVPALAQQIGLKAVISPVLASVLSAYGAATADVRRDKAIAVDEVLPLGTDRQDDLWQLRNDIDQQLAANNVAAENREFIYEADLRLFRQKASLTLPIPDGRLDTDQLASTFRSLYAERYGAAALTLGTAVELSTLRVIGVGRTVRASMPIDPDNVSAGTAPAPQGQRPIWLGRADQVDVDVFRMEALQPGHRVTGPAIIDTVDTSLWTPLGMCVDVDAERSLISRSIA